MDYIVTVRKVVGNKFVSEPEDESGASVVGARFLAVPSTVKPTPAHEIKKSNWIDQVQELAKRSSTGGTSSRGGDMVVFVHGYNVSASEMIESHRKLWRGLSRQGYLGTVVSFDWPSASSAFNYLEDRVDAKQTALRLVTDCILVFSELQRKQCDVNVHVLAHSTGAFVVREAFDDADDRRRTAESTWMVSQMMLIAADISAGSLVAGSSTTDSLIRHSVRLTNYSNPYDSVLKLSNVKRAGLAPRVGRVGLPADAPRNCVNVDCGRHWRAKYANRKKLIDTYSHSWYLDDDTFFADAVATIRGDLDRHVIPTRELDGEQLYLKSPAR